MSQEENFSMNNHNSNLKDQNNATSGINESIDSVTTDQTSSDSHLTQHVSLEEKLRYYTLPVISTLLIFVIWFKLYHPIVIDRWNLGIIYVENSQQIKDISASESQLEKGGAIIKEEIKNHPYHARVWHLLGKYYLAKENWDSCIYAEKKAIELGSGGVVNQVEFMAADNLNLALQKKLNLASSLDTSLLFIKEAELSKFDNFVLDKFRGMLYSKYKMPDSSIVYFKKYIVTYPDDGYVLMKIAENYMRKNDKKNAELFLNKAKLYEGENPQLDSLSNKINAIIN